jgi:phosphopantetheinyl transferase
MKQDHSDQVRDRFATLAQDCTPVSLGEGIRMLYVPFSPDPQASLSCASVLSKAELMIADRFLDEADADHFIQRRAFRRYCGAVARGTDQIPLSKIIFAETDKGRLSLERNAELWFSFSSCRLGFLGAWSSTHAIGVDIEDRTRSLETIELAQHYFSEDEARTVSESNESDRVLTFVKFWSLKESALKSVGEGLPLGLDAFAFELHPVLRVTQAPADQGGPAQFAAHLIEGRDTCAALVTHLIR